MSVEERGRRSGRACFWWEGPLAVGSVLGSVVALQRVAIAQVFEMRVSIERLHRFGERRGRALAPMLIDDLVGRAW
jgi:hypothetical protein